ncbi:hypothetical protein [Wolbachia endosymbiont of Tribolium confusum]|uniref:hypothetical protein n=1 Tax=Wolbachia endosymbiont of Tribolium confusum TaxID=214474 RepID=UPI001CF3C775|nr:hypothetical protein [Wolbachia endosymbiont of Tribolium confusum]MCA7010906.1 hypothetical protein [Wolbachia endosymbiont of Tribolium confusum]
MLKHTKNAAAYRNKEEADKAYSQCVRKCVKDSLGDEELRTACIKQCREGDWSFENAKLSEQLSFIVDQSFDKINDLSSTQFDLYSISSDLSLMGL